MTETKGSEVKRGRRKPDPEWRGLFLMHLAEEPNVAAAASFAGINRWTAYHERKKNAAFIRARSDAFGGV